MNDYISPQSAPYIQIYCFVIGKFCYHMAPAYGVLPVVSLTYTRWQIVQKLRNINL